jgi:putative ABC transport system permease protein
MSGILSLRMAYQHMRVALGRNALSVLAVTLGVALAVAVHLMNGAVMNGFVDAIDDIAGRAALRVTAGEGLGFDEAVVDIVKGVPGVEHAAPLVTGVAFPDDGSGELLSVYGIDIGNDASVRLYHRGDTGGVIDDLVEFLNSKTAIVLGREFAERRGLSVGSTLDLFTPRGRQQFVVRGLLSPEGIARTLGGRLVVMDIFAAELAFTAERQINQIDLVVSQGREEAVKAAVQARLPLGFTVEEPAVRKDVIRKTVRGIQALLGAFAALAVVAGFVICFSRITSIFEARTWEIGLLRSVGLRRSVVFLDLLKESALLGLAGTIGGIPLGILIGQQGLPLAARTAALQSRLAVPATTIAPDLSTILLGALVGIGAATLAAAVPALRMARREPIAALTFRGRELIVPDGPRRWPFRVALLTIGLLLTSVQLLTRMTGLGYLTTGLIAAGTCFVARPVVKVGGYLAERLLDVLIGPAASLEIAPVTRQPRRAALTTATLGLGLGVILMGGIVARSLERTIVSQLAARLKADLVVTSAFMSGGYISAPLAEEVGGRIERLPGVAGVAAEQEKDVSFADGVAVLDAWDPACFRDNRLCEWHLERGALDGALSRVARGDAGIVSTSFVRQFGAGPGDTVTFDSPTGQQRFLVVGVTRDQPATAIMISRDRYRSSWNDTKAIWIHVAIAKGALADGIAESIRRELGQSYRLQVRSGAQLIDFLASQVGEGFKFLYILQAITFALVLIGMADTLASSVLDRTREFGMMRAVGLRRSHLFRMVLVEGGTIGLIGLVLAWGAGLVLGLFWVEVQFPALLGWSLDLHFPYWFAAAAAVLTMVLCLFGASLPALHAARLAVPEALRSE